MSETKKKSRVVGWGWSNGIISGLKSLLFGSASTIERLINELEADGYFVMGLDYERQIILAKLVETPASDLRSVFAIPAAQPPQPESDEELETLPGQQPTGRMQIKGRMTMGLLMRIQGLAHIDDDNYLRQHLEPIINGVCKGHPLGEVATTIDDLTGLEKLQAEHGRHSEDCRHTKLVKRVIEQLRLYLAANPPS